MGKKDKKALEVAVQPDDNTTTCKRKGEKRPRNEKAGDAGTAANEDFAAGRSEPKKAEIDEIDDLFATAKKAKKEAKRQEEEKERERRKRRQMQRDEASSNRSSGTPGPKKRSAKKISLSYTRDDTEAIRSGEWAADGLGGVFDHEGFTGRKDDSGMKIFKAHLFNKPGFGTTKDCPFDCDCCYI